MSESTGEGFSPVGLPPRPHTRIACQSQLQVVICAPEQTMVNQSEPLKLPSLGLVNLLAFPSPGDLFNPGIEPMSHMFPALTRGFFVNSKQLINVSVLTASRTSCPLITLSLLGSPYCLRQTIRSDQISRSVSGSATP